MLINFGVRRGFFGARKEVEKMTERIIPKTCNLCADKHCVMESKGHFGAFRKIIDNKTDESESGSPYTILGCEIYKAKQKENGK